MGTRDTAPCVADIISQRPRSMFLGTPVQPCPRTKRNNVIAATLCLCFQDRWSGKKRQDAYNAAQKSCPTLFLNTPLATLVRVRKTSNIKARQDREVSPAQVSTTLLDL